MTNTLVDVFHATVELENLENNVKVEVSKLIRKRLKESSLNFINGNDLDILIDNNVDIESIVSDAFIQEKK
mgnify:FL=1|jgi:hypothetical protein|tara:strand:+ start:711 stop:923 length:213 start_codon:yes stop_codon:yes gene_type:complete